MTSSAKARWITGIITFGFFLSVAFHYVLAVFLGEGFPRSTFMPALAPFGDFFAAYDQWRAGQFNFVGYGLSYFPSTYLIIDPFTRVFGDYRYTAAGVFLALPLAFSWWYFYRGLKIDGKVEAAYHAALWAAMSYPFLFTVHTGNLEIYQFMSLGLFLFFYQRREPALAGLFLAWPISMKVFPAVFVLLPLADRRWRELAWMCAWGLALTLLPLILFDGGLRSGLGGYLHNLKASQSMYKELMIMGDAGNHFGHSLLNLLRIVAGRHFPAMQGVILPWVLFSLAALGALAAWVVLVEKELWKRVALMAVAMNLLPFTSTDYKLLHLFLPLVLFIEHGRKDRWDMAYTLMFGLLLIPKDYGYLNSNPLYTWNCLLNPLLMLGLAALIVGSRAAAARHGSGAKAEEPKWALR